MFISCLKFRSHSISVLGHCFREYGSFELLYLRFCNASADCILANADIFSRVKPPPFWYAVFRLFRRYTVRKGSVRCMQKSCYIVRSHQLLILKCAIFIKKHNNRDICMSNNSKSFAHVLRSRLIFYILTF